MYSRERHTSTSDRWRSVRPHSPPSRPQSYSGPPPSFPHNVTRRSRPSSIMSAGSIDSGFGEGDIDATSHRRSSRISQPPTNYHYTAPPAYTHNPYYPTYLPATPYYSTTLGHTPNSLTSIPQFSRLPVPSANNVPSLLSNIDYPPTPLSSISPGSQPWAPATNSPYSLPYTVDNPDYMSCLRLSAYLEGELTSVELQTSITELKALPVKLVANLIRLFAVRDYAKAENPPLKSDEFLPLWQCLREWIYLFEAADVDQDGRISCSELQTALGSYAVFGFQMTTKILDECVKTFIRQGNESSSLDFECFLTICVGLKRITTSFAHWAQASLWFEKYALGKWINFCCSQSTS